MKKITLISGLFVFALILSGCSQKDISPEQKGTLAPPAPKVVLDEGEKNEVKTIEPKMNEDVFKNAPNIELTDVADGKAEGKAWVLIKNGKTLHKAVASNMPELTNGDFYEGWLVKQPVAGGFFSTGKMIMDENTGEYMLNFETPGDKSEYRSVVITIEPDDGNPAPAAHILEGSFAPEVNFELE